MLQKDAVESRTLALIRQFHKDKMLKGFALAGDTALALYLGHRKSEDIDLFTEDDFDAGMLLEYLEEKYRFSVQYTDVNTLKGFIDGVFVDMITHNYPLVAEKKVVEDIRIYSEQDIAAMKVNAIAGDGTRIKDFIDIYFLLKRYSLAEIISFYAQKYGSRNEFHAIKSLEYFDDLDPDPAWPVMLKEKNLSLEQIKSTISGAIANYIKE